MKKSCVAAALVLCGIFCHIPHSLCATRAQPEAARVENQDISTPVCASAISLVQPLASKSIRVDVRVTPAKLKHLRSIQRLFRRVVEAAPGSLYFVTEGMWRDGIENREVYLATVGPTLVGFMRLHTRRDGQITIHDLGVDPGFQQKGIGKLLFDSLPAGTRLLRCSAKNTNGNRAYASWGMQLFGFQQPRADSPRPTPTYVWIDRGFLPKLNRDEANRIRLNGKSR